MNDIERINRDINTSIRYNRDGRIDHWASLRETLATGYGDCEDIAIAKFFLLLEEDNLDPKLVYCFIDGVAHMVVYVDGWILDNIDKRVLSFKNRKDLEPVYAFNVEHLYLVDENWNFEIAGPSTRIKKWTKCMGSQYA